MVNLKTSNSLSWLTKIRSTETQEANSDPCGVALTPQVWWQQGKKQFVLSVISHYYNISTPGMYPQTEAERTHAWRKRLTSSGITACARVVISTYARVGTILDAGGTIFAVYLRQVTHICWQTTQTAVVFSTGVEGDMNLDAGGAILALYLSGHTLLVTDNTNCRGIQHRCGGWHQPWCRWRHSCIIPVRSHTSVDRQHKQQWYSAKVRRVIWTLMQVVPFLHYTCQVTHFCWQITQIAVVFSTGAGGDMYYTRTLETGGTLLVAHVHQVTHIWSRTT